MFIYIPNFCHLLSSFVGYFDVFPNYLKPLHSGNTYAVRFKAFFLSQQTTACDDFRPTSYTYFLWILKIFDHLQFVLFYLSWSLDGNTLYMRLI